MVLPRLFVDLQRLWHHLDGGALAHPVGGRRSPVPLGVDFRGGTQVEVQFKQSLDIEKIRQATAAAGIQDASIVNYDAPSKNEVLISLPEQHAESALDSGRQQIEDALKTKFGEAAFEIRNVQVVGPTVGKQLEKQATLATLYSLLGMLIYLWFRFQLIYGVAAVVACFHDTLITVGVFALLDSFGFKGMEISLTVIAAILTLVGYSMNDTIVVFDRIRENLRLSRRESLPGRGESQHQSDAEPDGADLRADVFDGAVAVHFWRAGSARIFVRACGGNSDWNVFVDCDCGSDAGGMAGMARRERESGGSSVGQAPRRARRKCTYFAATFAYTG